MKSRFFSSQRPSASSASGSRRKRQAQLSFDRFLPRHQRRRITYGGAQVTGSRKVKRPLHPRYPVHLVLKSSLAKGERSFLKNPHGRFISSELTRLTKAHGLKLIEWENVGNHLHLVLRFRDPAAVGKFLKIFCARISMRMLGTRKGRSTKKALGESGLRAEIHSGDVTTPRRFWDGTPFSRVVFERLKEGFGLMSYLRKNGYERMGWDKKTAELWARELPPGIAFGPPDGLKNTV